MKASQIWHAAYEADDFLAAVRRKPREHFGLDVTDFGLGRFDKFGLAAYVIVNCPEYCSKWLVLADDQVCPNHYHRRKKETITCEAGTIRMQLFGSSHLGQAFVDRRRNIDYVYNGKPKVNRPTNRPITITMRPGDSITLFPGTWHKFWAVDDYALAVEVSTVNNDFDDNVFEDEEIGRFVQKIEQDMTDMTVRLDKKGFVHFDPK